MIMRKIILAISIIVFFLPAKILATGPPLNSAEGKFKPSGIISFVPQYFLINGLRLDYDLPVNANHWIQMAPVFFYKNTPSDGALATTRNNSQRGAGLHVYHRYYPADGFGATKVYLAYGPMYHYNHLQYEERSPAARPERYTAIHKAGLDVILGFNTVWSENMTVDFYFGMGMRHSFISSDADHPKKFNDSYIDFGYSGNVLLIGFRVGFVTGTRP